MLEIDVTRRLGDFQLNARLVSDGRITALFGRSGSGKTSLVNIIAGLASPDRGRVAIQGEVLVDTKAGLRVPAHKRRIGYVFQEARLFPHLTVRQNLLFGQWFSARPAEPGVTLSDVVDLLGLGHLLGRRPEALSGGETQRIAIGRALLAHPRLLLMDEPLASLDEARKAEILPYIERLRDLGQTPIIYVTHSVAELCRLANIMAVLDGGVVQACGPPGEIMRRFDITTLAGITEPSSLLEARVIGEEAPFDLSILETSAGVLRIMRRDLPVGRLLSVRVLASDVLVSLTAPPDISALNILQGEVLAIAPSPGHGWVDLRIACGSTFLVARVTTKSAQQLRLAVGSRVFAIIKAVAIV